jgi:hypothetical protein
MLAALFHGSAALILLIAGITLVAGLIVMGPLAVPIVIFGLIGWYQMRVYLRREKERGSDAFLDAYYSGHLDGRQPRGPQDRRQNY